jgi:hypothetical protein
MTKEEILEGNRLIAEFMGGKFYRDTPLLLMVPVISPAGNKIKCIDKLRYHESFDWLIPVAKKAAHHVRVNDRGFSMQKRIHEALNTFDIEALYGSVITFINWYNTTTTL